MNRKPISESKLASSDKLHSDSAHRWHFSGRDCLLILPTACFTQLQKWAQKSLPHETGGTLVGTISPDRRIATVVEVLHASAMARRSLFTFFRPSDKDDQSLLKLLQQRPNLTYIGEWHTHPNAEPIPSGLDRDALATIANSPNTCTETPIMLILGQAFTAENSAAFLGGPANYFERGVAVVL